jgi:P-type Cu2+ transporter
VLYVVVDGRVIGTVAVEDESRPESAEAVKELHDLGVRVAMITGDSHAVADSVAKRIGIDKVAAQVLPADRRQRGAATLVPACTCSMVVEII